MSGGWAPARGAGRTVAVRGRLEGFGEFTDVPEDGPAGRAPPHIIHHEPEQATGVTGQRHGVATVRGPPVTPYWPSAITKRCQIFPV